MAPQFLPPPIGGDGGNGGDGDGPPRVHTPFGRPGGPRYGSPPGPPSGGTPSGSPPSGPSSGSPPSGPSSGGTPSGGTPSGGTPSGGTPSGGTPSGGTPSGGTPSGGTPSGGTPSGGTPTSEKLKQLCDELHQALGNGTIRLPNNTVTAVDVNDFLKDVLKVSGITFTSASVTCNNSSVTVKGSFSLFGVQLNVTWSFKSENDGTITWTFVARTGQTSTVKSLLSHFTNSRFSVPQNLSSLEICSISFSTSLNTGDKKYSLNLSANTGWGRLQLFVKDNAGTWGIALGIGVSDTFRLSTIDSAMGVFNPLEFSKSAIVIADFTDPKLKIAGIKGVVDGVEFQSTLGVAKNSGTTPLSIIINELSSSLEDIPVQVTVDLTKRDFKLNASIGKTFSLPGFSKVSLSKIDLMIDTTPSVNLSGDLHLPIQVPANPTVNSIDVTGDISFVYSSGTGTIEATLNSTTKITDPFDFDGVTLTDVGVGLNVAFGAEDQAGVTLEGAFQLGTKTKMDEKFAITVDFNVEDELPNPSLLYCQTKNLTLATIFDAVIHGVKLPSIFEHFEFNDLIFYWADQAQNLPDGTLCQVGIGYNATTDFWGFHTYSELKIDKDHGISGQASIDPISLLDGKITLTGSGKGGHDVKSGGAYFDFDTSKESFNASVNASILGIKEVIRASVSSSSLDISMNTKLAFLQDSVEVKVTNSYSNIEFDTSLKIGINCEPDIWIFGVHLGKLHLDAEMDGDIKFSYNKSYGKETLSVKVDAKFDLEGVKINFSYDLEDILDDFANLGSAIEQKIVDEAGTIFADFFNDVENFISVIGKGLLTDGEFVVNTLYHVYSHEITEIFDLLSHLPDQFHVDGQLDFAIHIAPSIAAQPVHGDLGHLLNAYADVVVFHAHGDIKLSETVYTPGFTVDLIDINANEHLDMYMPPTVHADATSGHVDIHPHVDAHFVGGDFHISGNTAISTRVSPNITDIDLDARFNIYVDGGVNAGIYGDALFLNVHADKHGDVHPYIDVAIDV